MSMSTATSKKSIFDGRKMWFIFGAIASAVVAILTFSLMSVVTATETYYVLNTDVPARTQVTQSLLTEVTVSRGSTPPNAIGISDIDEETYTLYALDAGDILTSSNSGSLISLSEGLPDDFVVASFTVDPSSAAGGNVKRGDYIDILTIMNDPQVTGSSSYASSYVLQHVLVVDATVDLDSYDSEAETTAGEDGAVDGEAADEIAKRSGIPTLFTVGLTQKDAAALAVATQYDLFVVISSTEAQNGDVNLTPGSATSEDIWGDSAPDAGKGTDRTFGQGGEVVRPEDEAPVEEAPTEPTTPTTPDPAETPTTPDTGDTTDTETVEG